MSIMHDLEWVLAVRKTLRAAGASGRRDTQCGSPAPALRICGGVRMTEAAASYVEGLVARQVQADLALVRDTRPGTDCAQLLLGHVVDGGTPESDYVIALIKCAVEG